MTAWTLRYCTGEAHPGQPCIESCWFLDRNGARRVFTDGTEALRLSRQLQLVIEEQPPPAAERWGVRHGNSRGAAWLVGETDKAFRWSTDVRQAFAFTKAQAEEVVARVVKTGTMFKEHCTVERLDAGEAVHVVTAEDVAHFARGETETYPLGDKPRGTVTVVSVGGPGVVTVADDCPDCARMRGEVQEAQLACVRLNLSYGNAPDRAVHEQAITDAMQLRAEKQELLAENATLRRRIEKLERKR